MESGKREAAPLTTRLLFARARAPKAPAFPVARVAGRRKDARRKDERSTGNTKCPRAMRARPSGSNSKLSRRG